MTTDRMGQAGYNAGGDPGNLPDPDFTNSFWGTSAAAPQVAAAAAILRSFVPSLGPDAIKGALTGTAQKVGGPGAGYDARGFSEKYGYGLLDTGAALESLMEPAEGTASITVSGELADQQRSNP